MIKFQYDLLNEKSLISEIHMNDKMIKLIGLCVQDFWRLNFTDLECLKFFKTRNWSSFYEKLLEFIYQDKTENMRLNNNDFYLVNSSGDKVSGIFVIIKQKNVQKNGVTIEEIYFVFIEQKYLDEKETPKSDDDIIPKK